MAHFTMNTTIDPNDIRMSVMITRCTASRSVDMLPPYRLVRPLPGPVMTGARS
jgi:hypothetical protein